MLRDWTSKMQCWTSLVVQWLRLSTPALEGMGSIPGWWSSICYVVQKKKKKFYVEKKNQAINENISRSYNSSHEEDSHVHLDNI